MYGLNVEARRRQLTKRNEQQNRRRIKEVKYRVSRNAQRRLARQTSEEFEVERCVEDRPEVGIARARDCVRTEREAHARVVHLAVVVDERRLELLALQHREALERARLRERYELLSSLRPLTRSYILMPAQ